MNQQIASFSALLLALHTFRLPAWGHDPRSLQLVPCDHDSINQHWRMSDGHLHSETASIWGEGKCVEVRDGWGYGDGVGDIVWVSWCGTRWDNSFGADAFPPSRAPFELHGPLRSGSTADRCLGTYLEPVAGAAVMLGSCTGGGKALGWNTSDFETHPSALAFVAEPVGEASALRINGTGLCLDVGTVPAKPCDGAEATRLFCDSGASLDERTADLVGRLSTAELIYGP